jgi:hypothetical protein
MLENIIEILIKRIRDEIVNHNQGMTNVPLAYLMTRNIPESVKHFFDQEVELWLREEEEKFNTDERFDYDQPEVRMLIDQIFDLLKQNAFFHMNKFNQLLERAVKLEMNYLIEPHRTLTHFIFKDSPIVSTMEVYDTLKYFFRYEYYKNAISDYFNQKYMREISQDQFEQLINQIDDNIFSENRFETTLKTVKTITSFIGEALEKDIDQVDLDVLSHAFADRNLSSYSGLIDQLIRRGDSKISFADLEVILRDEAIPSETVEAPADETQLVMSRIENIEETQLNVTVDTIELDEMTVPEVEEAEEELEEEFEEYEEDLHEEEVAEKAPAPVEVVTEKQPDAEKSAKVADDLANFVATQIQSDKPLQDINELIVGRARKKIIKKLFRRNDSEYDELIAMLNQQVSWKEASRIIDDEFYHRGINPYSKEAISFSDGIYLRFFPKDKYVGEQDTLDKF